MSPAPDFAAWLAGFRAAHRSLARHLPSGLAPRPEIAARAASQAEFNLSAAAYMARSLTEARLVAGRAHLNRLAPLLAELRASHGVPGEIVIAIWGLESDFGHARGTLPVLSALATLAHAAPPGRSTFFEAELVAALRLIEAGRVPGGWSGSWAGASGHCQFMPSAIASHAVRARGRGVPDLWGDDPADALASVAHYLAAHGWQPGRGWLSEVPPDRPETLLVPAGLPGPAFETGPNFEPLIRYNRATFYALAVGLLAHAIAGRARLPVFPDRPVLSRAELARLQRRLTARGYDTKGADGIAGPATRDAIRAWQLAHGLPPDGFASRELLVRLGQNVPGRGGGAGGAGSGAPAVPHCQA